MMHGECNTYFKMNGGKYSPSLSVYLMLSIEPKYLSLPKRESQENPACGSVKH